MPKLTQTPSSSSPRITRREAWILVFRVPGRRTRTGHSPCQTARAVVVFKSFILFRRKAVVSIFGFCGRFENRWTYIWAPGWPMCLSGRPVVEKKAQCTEGPSALSALHQATGMGEYGGAEGVNFLALWATGKHRLRFRSVEYQPWSTCSSSTSSVPVVRKRYRSRSVWKRARIRFSLLVICARFFPKGSGENTLAKAMPI